MDLCFGERRVRGLVWAVRWVYEGIIWLPRLIFHRVRRVASRLVAPCLSKMQRVDTYMRNCKSRTTRKLKSGRTLKKELHPATIDLVTPDPDQLVSCMWVRPSIIYVVYLHLVFVYFTVWFIVSWVKDGPKLKVKKLCYLTEWTYIMLLISLITRARLARLAYRKQTACKHYRAGHWKMDNYLRSSWLLYNISSCASLVVSISYFLFLYDVNKKSSRLEQALDVHRHILQSVFVLCDMFISAIPIRIYHVYQTMIYFLIFAIFSMAYVLVPPGFPAVYSYLDWENNPGKAALYSFLLVFIAPVIVWLLIFFLFRIRKTIYSFKHSYTICKVTHSEGVTNLEPIRGWEKVNSTGREPGWQYTQKHNKNICNLTGNQGSCYKNLKNDQSTSLALFQPPIIRANLFQGHPTNFDPRGFRLLHKYPSSSSFTSSSASPSFASSSSSFSVKNNQLPVRWMPLDNPRSTFHKTTPKVPVNSQVICSWSKPSSPAVLTHNPGPKKYCARYDAKNCGRVAKTYHPC